MRMRSRRDSCATVWRPSSSMTRRGYQSTGPTGKVADLGAGRTVEHLSHGRCRRDDRPVDDEFITLDIVIRYAICGRNGLREDEGGACPTRRRGGARGAPAAGGAPPARPDWPPAPG